MKLKHFFGATLVCVSLFTIYAFTSDFSMIENESEYIEVEAVVATKYCKYNVTQSTVPGLTNEGGIACTPCPDMGKCDKTVMNYKVKNSGGKVIGEFSGKIANTSRKYKTYPPGFITN